MPGLTSGSCRRVTTLASTSRFFSSRTRGTGCCFLGHSNSLCRNWFASRQPLHFAFLPIPACAARVPRGQPLRNDALEPIVLAPLEKRLRPPGMTRQGGGTARPCGPSCIAGLDRVGVPTMAAIGDRPRDRITTRRRRTPFGRYLGAAGASPTFRSSRTSFSPPHRKSSDSVASARPLEILIFGDMPLEDVVARAVPHCGWLAELASEHFLVRRAGSIPSKKPKGQEKPP